MLRRLIAIAGTLALAIAYLPGVVDGLSASAAPNCCNGIMCPMHHMADGQVLCDMDMAHPGTSFQSCPDSARHYTAALAFIRVAPSVFFAERVVSPAIAFVSRFPLNAYLGVVLPPPRVSLA